MVTTFQEGEHNMTKRCIVCGADVEAPTKRRIEFDIIQATSIMKVLDEAPEYIKRQQTSYICRKCHYRDNPVSLKKFTIEHPWGPRFE